MSTRMKIVSGLGILGLLFVLSPSAARASSVCATPNGGSEGGITPDAGYLADGGGCNVLITFGSGGSIVTTNPNTNGFYDSGAEDNLVGIVNNSGSTLFSINLSSATQNIFGFDGDGVCGGGFTFAAGPNCTGHLAADTSGYGGPGVTFTAISPTLRSGTVNFAGGIANGGTAFFSLEGPVDLAHGGSNPTVPESATSSLLVGGLGILFLMRKRFVSQN